MTLITSTAIYFVLIFLLAGAVKGVVGLGLPTVAMGLLSLRMPPAEAAALLLLPSFITNVWQLAEGSHLGSLVRRLWPTLLAIFVSTVIAAGVIASTKSAVAMATLGGALLLYAIAGLLNFHVNVSPHAERWAGPIIGAVTGVITGITGTFVVPAVPYLAGLGLPRDELVQTLGLSFTVSTVALGLGLLWHDALELQAVSNSAIAVVPALLGMMIGSCIRRHVSPERFRRWFFVGLGLLAIHLVHGAL
jgi:uncharacterized membrane protein YfcA